MPPKGDYNVLNNDICRMKEQITDLKKTFKEELGEIKTTVKEFIDGADAKYATKEELEHLRDNSYDNVSVAKEWIKSWGTVIVAFIGAIAVIVPKLLELTK